MSDPFTMTLVLTAVQAGLSMALAPHIKGPRLDDRKVTVADYGTPLPRFWGIRKFQPPIMWAEKLREEKVTSKTKGGKYTQYKYYGTWAVALADCDIEAVTRIWFDKHLVYQTRYAGPISIGLLLGLKGPVKLQRGQNMRIYYGSETQQPDRRMEAWCEDRYGPDSCPAYRGVSYIVFEDIPLEKLGNHIPQISVEVVRAKSDAWLYETRTQDSSVNAFQFSPSKQRIIAVSGGTYEVWDVANRTRIVSGLPTTIGDYAADDGGFVGVDGFTFQSVLRVNIGGSETVIVPNTGVGLHLNSFYSCGGQFWAADAGGSTLAYVIGGVTVNSVDVGIDVDSYFEDLNGDVWAVGDDGSNIRLYNLNDLTALSIASSTTGTAYGMANESGNFVLFQNDTLFLFDPTALTLIGSTAVVSSAFNAEVVMRNVEIGAPSIWFGFKEYSTEDLSLIRTVALSNWGLAFSISTSGILYDPVNDALLTQDFFNQGTLYWLYLDRAANAGVTLKTIVDEVSLWCGLLTQDASALTQLIDGYSVTQGSGKDMLAPLLDMHDVDARPHDFTVQFVNRGSAPSGTILTEDFVRGDNRYAVTVQQDTDVPRRVTFTYADVDHDQQPNTAISQRPLDAADSQREEQIDLNTYAADANTAQQLADRYFRRQWNSRERPKNAVTAQLLALEPGDVRTLQFRHDDNSIVLRNCRLDKMTLRGSTIDCEWVRDETGFAVLNGATGATMDGRDDEVIFFPSLTRGFILDTPLIEDADNDVNPLIYALAGKYTSGWAGAFAYRGDDGTYDEVVAAIDSTAGATHGIVVSGILNDPDPNMWDRGSQLSVQVYGDILTSATEAEIDADPSLNLAAIGANGRWEFVNFATATLTASDSNSNTYTVTGFKRGRRGTEANIGNHATSDAFVLLSTAVSHGMGTDDVGGDASFKIASVGRDPNGEAPIDLTPYTGASLKPYSPARVKWEFDGTDLQGTIFRRTRVGGSWNGSTISLGETSEDYEVDVPDGSGNVLRTITVTGTNTFSYTAAMAAADGVTLPTPPDINAYQMSSSVGRGFALAA